jgi:HEAT repeat protein
VSLALLCSAAPARAEAFDADDATGKELISYLDHESWKYRVESLEEIGDRSLIQAVDKVVEMARSDEHHKVRHEALGVLGELESSWLLPTAEYMVVEDPVEHNREDALEILKDKGEGSRTAMVLGKVVLGDHVSDLREAAARILRKKKWTGAEEALARAALRDGESDVRRECRRALVIVGGEKYRPVLHRILMDEPNNKLRLELARLIKKSPIAADKSALLEALDDPYGKVAIVAAKALVKLGDRSVAKTLREKALETTDRSVAEEFNEAAEDLGG